MVTAQSPKAFPRAWVMPAVQHGQPLLFLGGSGLGASLLSHPLCPFCHMGDKISSRGSFGCLYWVRLVSFWGAFEVQRCSGGALEDTLENGFPSSGGKL